MRPSYLMATKPDLGIKNPYQLDEAQFDAAVALLEKQKPTVGEYWATTPKQIARSPPATPSSGTSWQVNVNLLQGADRPCR